MEWFVLFIRMCGEPYIELKKKKGEKKNPRAIKA